MLKKDKKGFTLAELLIVVAIIGVLVAIAVPLFVGALSKAEDGVKTANERSLKGMAVITIMTEQDKYLYDNGAESATKGQAYKFWTVKGQYVKSSDTIKITSIEGAMEKPSSPGSSAKTADGYDLVVVVTASELTVG